MKIGRSIRIYLDDGTISGIKHAEIVNWTGQALSVPRTQVKMLLGWDEAKKPGVYFLFGIDESSGEQAVYIGEAENVYDRLQSHIANKEFWNEVVVFTNKDENLTKSHVKYLEARLVQMAKVAGRYKLLNGNEPQQPLMPRGDRDAMEEFLSNLRILLGVIGHKALEQLISTERKISPTMDESTSDSDRKEIRVNMRLRNISSTAIVNDEGIVVLAGSEAAVTIKESLSGGYKKLRKQLIETGVLTKQDSKYIFTKDQLFTSPSQAAAIIVGYAVNGRQNWQTEEGISLKSLEEDM